MYAVRSTLAKVINHFFVDTLVVDETPRVNDRTFRLTLCTAYLVTENPTQITKKLRNAAV